MHTEQPQRIERRSNIRIEQRRKKEDDPRTRVLRETSKKISAAAYKTFDEIDTHLKNGVQAMMDHYGASRAKLITVKMDLKHQNGMYDNLDDETTKNILADNAQLIDYIDNYLAETDQQMAVMQNKKQRVTKNWSLDTRPVQTVDPELAEIAQKWKQEASELKAKPSLGERVKKAWTRFWNGDWFSKK